MYGWGTIITWSLIETCKSSLNRLRKPTQSYCIAIKSSMDVLYVGTKKNLYVMFYAIVSFYMDLDTKFSTYHCFHISSEIKKKQAGSITNWMKKIWTNLVFIGVEIIWSGLTDYCGYSNTFEIIHYIPFLVFHYQKAQFLIIL